MSLFWIDEIVVAESISWFSEARGLEQWHARWVSSVMEQFCMLTAGDAYPNLYMY